MTTWGSVTVSIQYKIFPISGIPGFCAGSRQTPADTGKAGPPPAPHTTWRARPLRRCCHSNPESQSEPAVAAGGRLSPRRARAVTAAEGSGARGCAAALPRSDATAGAVTVTASRVVATAGGMSRHAGLPRSADTLLTMGECRDMRAWTGARCPVDRAAAVLFRASRHVGIFPRVL